MRLLLVEDHAPTRASMEAYLIACGWTVSSHASVEQALQTHPADVDIALIDLRLGERTGLDVVRRLSPATPCIVLTQSADAEDLAKAFQAGATGYLLKSDAPATVHAALEQALAGGLPLSASVTHHLLAPLRPASSPYTLHVDLNGHRAILDDPSIAECVYTSEQSVHLLYALGRHQQRQSDGWLDDDDLATSIWGRARLRQNTNNLNVLLWRIRKKARETGYTTPFIERAGGRTRLAVGRVVLLQT